MEKDESKDKDLEEQIRQSQKLEAIGRLAGGIAHDFNNILLAIMGHCEILHEELGDQSPLLKELAGIRHCANQGATLTRQLLAFSRKQALQVVAVDLNALVSDLEKMLRRLIDENIQMEVLAEATTGYVLGDPDQIGQILLNLVVNARDAMPEGGKLTIKIQHAHLDPGDEALGPLDLSPGSYGVLEVSDTGIGMDDEVKKRLFEPYFTTKSKGNGLGLSTVYGIVKQLGGTLSVWSEPGRGSSFRVFLRQTRATPPHPVGAADAVDAVGGHELVLVVEDDPSVRRALQSMLEQLGYTVRTAEEGREAIACVEKEGFKPDLLVTDVVMPGLSGPAVAKRLSALVPDLPVLFISGYHDCGIAKDATLPAGSAFLEKPFSRYTLSKKLNLLLDHGSPKDSRQ